MAIRKIIFLSFLSVSFFCQQQAPAQSKHTIDSLQNVLKTFDSKKTQTGNTPIDLKDTNRIVLLDSLSRQFYHSGFKKAISYAYEALLLAKKAGYKKGVASSYHNLGNINLENGFFIDAIDNFQLEIKARQDMNDNKGVVKVYLIIADIYYNQGIYPASTNYSIAALKISDEIKDASGTGAAQVNIGKIYCKQANYKKALVSFNKAMRVLKKAKDTLSIADCYTNMGILFFNKKNYHEAIANYNRAINVLTYTRYFKPLTALHMYIGNVYEAQNNNTEAIVFYLTSLKRLEEMNDKERIAFCCIHIGTNYLALGNIELALTYSSRGLNQAKELKLKELMKDGYKSLATIYASLKKFDIAYENQLLFQNINDSLFNDETKKRILEINLQAEYDEKNAKIKAEEAEQEKEIQKQKLIKDSLFGGFVIVLLFSVIFFNQRNNVRKEKQRSDELLLNILPEQVAEELKTTGSAIARHYDMVTVMFTDFKNFTLASEEMSAKDLVQEIHYYYSEFDKIISRHGIEKIKTIGDSYMCAGGLPVANTTNAVECVKAALEIQEFMKEIKERKQKHQKPFFEIRIGLHTGPVVAGIVGIHKFAYDIWGDAVNIASRMESSSEPGKINISGDTYEFVKNEFTCTYRGKIDAKNKGEVDMYFVG